MLYVKINSIDELSEEEKEKAPDNGFGMTYARYIRVVHDGETILLESDAMEPEDAIFTRDLKWVKEALQKCYDLGVADGRKASWLGEK